MSLEVVDPKYLEAVRSFADTLGPAVRVQFEEKLKWLAEFRDNTCHCKLFKDFAPYSFNFLLYGPTTAAEPEERPIWFNGGLIYYGGGSGAGAPQYSVSLSSDESSRWEIHT